RLQPRLPQSDDDARPASRPKIILIVDDVGLDRAAFEHLMALPGPVTLSILPYVRGAQDYADRARRAGGQNMLARMSELMFAELVRRYLQGLPAEQNGWLAGLRDRQIGKALALIHGDAARPWTLAELASGAALSRSAFAERFTRLMDMSPMQYLTGWRMQLASELLLASRHTVAAIALQVGYESEAAFARAFRRMAGVPPASWRRERSTLAQLSGASPLAFSAHGGVPTVAALGT
ncbi:MAG: helix-turn-helix domain-containing protein, partial [Gammaproteobacteria bacterium]|nr:helix-turn-helix domain-containing protein [Gammaproteobacteria bacterium]